MRQFLCLDKIPRRQTYIATIGNFDGVHQGHRSLINRMRQLADKNDSKVLLVSFQCHPRLGGDLNYQLLMSEQQRDKNLSDLGVDYLTLLDFKKVKDIEYVDFLEAFNQALDIKVFIASNKLCIGRKRKGTMDKVKLALRKINPTIQTLVLPTKKKGASVISSSEIRKLLSLGQVKKANIFLGAPFSVEGKAKKGAKRGRTIGFPTLNLAPPSNQFLPKPGVYLTNVIIAKKRYNAMTFVGIPMNHDPSKKLNKNDPESQFIVESHLFNFSKTGYNFRLRVEFVKFLRDNQYVRSLDALKLLLENDKKRARRFFP